MNSSDITWQSKNHKALLGILRIDGVRVVSSSVALKEKLYEAGLEPPVAAESWDTAIRSMLRLGGFKPSGRNRPAQEYLAKTAATCGGLPTISNVVDINNLFSLQHRLPASVIDASLLKEGATGTGGGRGIGEKFGLIIREGKEGESYPFNSSGQELRLEGLICLCTRLARTSHRPSAATTDPALPASLRFVDRSRRIAENTPSIDLGRKSCRQYHLSRFPTKAGEKSGLGVPVASPVKDSMSAHVSSETKSIVACVYGSLDLFSHKSMFGLLRELSTLVSEYAGGEVSGVVVASCDETTCIDGF